MKSCRPYGLTLLFHLEWHALPIEHDWPSPRQSNEVCSTADSEKDLRGNGHFAHVEMPTMTRDAVEGPSKVSVTIPSTKQGSFLRFISTETDGIGFFSGYGLSVIEEAVRDVFHRRPEDHHRRIVSLAFLLSGVERCQGATVSSPTRGHIS